MHDQSVDSYPSIIKCFPEYFMAQEVRDKGVNSYFFYLILFLININSRNV